MITRFRMQLRSALVEWLISRVTNQLAQPVRSENADTALVWKLVYARLASQTLPQTGLYMLLFSITFTQL